MLPCFHMEHYVIAMKTPIDLDLLSHRLLYDSQQRPLWFN